MFALRPVAFPVINVVIPEFVNNKLPDEYEIPLLYHVSRGSYDSTANHRCRLEVKTVQDRDEIPSSKFFWVGLSVISSYNLIGVPLGKQARTLKPGYEYRKALFSAH